MIAYFNYKTSKKKNNLNWKSFIYLYHSPPTPSLFMFSFYFSGFWFYKQIILLYLSHWTLFFKRYLLKYSPERRDNFMVWRSFYVLSVFVYIKKVLTFSKDVVCRIKLMEDLYFTLIKVQLEKWTSYSPLFWSFNNK